MRRLVKMSILLMVMLLAVNVVVLGRARLTNRDPFLPYMRIMPGHSIEALSDYSCHLLTVNTETSEVGYCQFHPEDGVFNQISVVETNQVITKLNFNIIPFKILLGDQILCLGKPQYLPYNYPIGRENAANLYWDSEIRGLVSPLINLERPDYFLPITYLSIAFLSDPADEERLLCG